MADMVAAADAEVDALPGVTTAAGVRLNDRTRAFLRRLRRRVPSSIPLHVSSGDRTGAEQASAMLTKLREGGAEELRRTYRDKAAIEELLELVPDVSTWSRRIQDLADEGRMLSRHMRGAAIDLRTRDLTAGQVAQLQTAVEAEGGRHLYEGVPPHLHVDVPPALVVVPGGPDAVDPPRVVDDPGWTVGEALAVGVVLVGVAWFGGPVVWPLLTKTAARVAARGVLL